METLTINIPEKKSKLVKQILKGLGVTFQSDVKTEPNKLSYRERILKVSTWSEEDIAVLEESKQAFESLKPQQW